MIRTITLVLAAAMLTACSSKPQIETASAAQPAQTSPQTTVATPAAQQPAAATSSDPVKQKVSDLAGSGAKDCGRLKTNDPAGLDSAASCVMDSSKGKKAFAVIYDMPGMSVAIAGNGEGKLFAVQAIQPEGGSSGAPQIGVTPCPAELRVAQSGRVTCFPQGSMGVPPGAANPHAGSASGSSPHSGMMPPPGTPNPHAGNMSTKPTAKTKSE
jgi:hypothetical protein